MFPHVVPDAEILGEDLIAFFGDLVIPLVQFLHVSPLRRAMLLTSAVVGLGVVVDQQDKPVYGRKDQNTRQRRLTPCNAKGMRESIPQLGYHHRESAAKRRGDQ